MRFGAHWIDYGGSVCVLLAALIFLIIGVPWFLVMSVIGVAAVAAALIHIEHRFFILRAESGGLLWGSGMIQRQRSQLAWSQIVSVQLQQTGTGRMCGYNDVVVSTTGWQKIWFKKVMNADQLLALWEKFRISERHLFAAPDLQTLISSGAEKTSQPTDLDPGKPASALNVSPPGLQ